MIATVKPKSGLWATAKRGLRDFALPEQTVNLKLVFDNLRNYLMCAGVVAVVRAAYQQPSNAEWPWALEVVIVLLAMLNVAQSWYIIQGIVDRLRSLPRVLEKRWMRTVTKLILITAFLFTVTAIFQVIPALLVAIASGIK